MNRRVSSGSSDGHVEDNSKVLVVGSSTLDDPTVHQSSSVREPQRLSDVGGAPDEPTP
jgi:hypothetical protein